MSLDVYLTIPQMSLDVYLTIPQEPETEPALSIYVRENGATRKISREEWDARFPGSSGYCSGAYKRTHRLRHHLGGGDGDGGQRPSPPSR